MRVFLMTYEYKLTKIDGFVIVQAKTFDDARNKVKSYFNDRVNITGLRSCENMDPGASAKILMSYDREMFYD